VDRLLCQLLSLYVYVLFGRVILSWFPISPGSAMASIYRVLHTLTEPVLGPIRRMLPPLGAFDLSPLVVILIVSVLQRSVC
jgi:YggT family protein